MGTDAPITECQRTAPGMIYLNIFTDDQGETFPGNHEGITWCDSPVADIDIPYVRADLCANLQADVGGLPAALITAACKACQGIPIEILEAQMAGGVPWSVSDQIDALMLQAELVEACKRLIGCMSAAGWEGAPDTEYARAAIAKATGGKP